MKIVLSSESYWPNKDGGAVFEHRFVHELIEHGHEVLVIVPGVKAHAYEEMDGASRIVRVASMPLPLNKGYKVAYTAARTVKRVLDEFQPDVIHVNTMWITGAALSRYAKKHSIPIVATNHLMPENVLLSLPKGLRESERVNDIFWKTIVRFHKRFVAVTSPTESALKLLRDNGLSLPMFAVSNGVDANVYHPPKPADENVDALKRFGISKTPYVLYLGRVNAEKRLDMLIDSFADVMQHDEKVVLVIAGKGNRVEALKQQAKERSMSQRVIFTGLVSDEEKVALMQHALVFAMTSPAELQCISMMEAMACGLPVVSVDVVALHELCHDGKNGFLVPLDDIAACSHALLTLIKDKKLREQFGAYSREYIVKHHSHESTYAQFIDLYEFAIRETGQKS